jgi:transposase
VEYFKRKGFDEITVVNPLKIKRTCGDIQKVKTDIVDCDRISAYYFFSQWKKPLTVSKEQREARELSRYIDFLQKEATRVGNKIRQNLSNVFPELERIGDSKGSLFKAGFLNLIEKTPHPLSIRKKTKAGIISTMAGKGRRDSSYAEYASLIIEAAKESLFSAPEGGIEASLILPNLARRLMELSKQIEDAEDKLESMTKEMPLFKVLQSFKGIGKGIASHLTAEIWSTEQYATPQKLIASAGINPSRSQSAASIDRYGRIVKAGNRYIRHWLFTAVGCILQQNGLGRGDKRLAEYYIKKHSSERDHHYVATIACANKLLRQVFYRSRDLAKTGQLIVK